MPDPDGLSLPQGAKCCSSLGLAPGIAQGCNLRAVPTGKGEGRVLTATESPSIIGWSGWILLCS